MPRAWSLFLDVDMVLKINFDAAWKHHLANATDALDVDAMLLEQRWQSGLKYDNVRLQCAVTPKLPSGRGAVLVDLALEAASREDLPGTVRAAVDAAYELDKQYWCHLNNMVLAVCADKHFFDALDPLLQEQAAALRKAESQRTE